MVPGEAAAASDDELRRRLLETAARLLGEEGPSALSTRRLAREAGTSTMAVYTHFGGMPALVREVVAEGFARLYAHVDEVSPTGDALEDLRQMAVAYRANALENPHLYAVMFGTASLGGYRLHEDEMGVGLAAFSQLMGGVERAMDSGALRRDDPAAVAGQMWAALHGYVMLELAGLLRPIHDPESRLLWPMLANLMAALA
ncbi:TetR/AcrR family transcriptional regulator [Nocardioides sp.]|jgi:AcrR family transcriptional regulator|uniref:TetR/AcrR family transcriptional regulator n=1 Tax=Nocardioides sp. TaxID=35761 RepID=UPI0031FEB06A|nr:TetR/AcrR family transcriptional regulator [Nocardioides sp.]